MPTKNMIEMAKIKGREGSELLMQRIKIHEEVLADRFAEKVNVQKRQKEIAEIIANQAVVLPLTITTKANMRDSGVDEKFVLAFKALTSDEVSENNLVLAKDLEDDRTKLDNWYKGVVLEVNQPLTPASKSSQPSYNDMGTVFMRMAIGGNNEKECTFIFIRDERKNDVTPPKELIYSSNNQTWQIDQIQENSDINFVTRNSRNPGQLIYRIGNILVSDVSKAPEKEVDIVAEELLDNK